MNLGHVTAVYIYLELFIYLSVLSVLCLEYYMQSLLILIEIQNMVQFLKSPYQIFFYRETKRKACMEKKIQNICK
jgi:hypothetical protein